MNMGFFFSKKNVAKRNEKDEGRNEILTDGMKSGNDEQPLQRLAVFRRTQEAEFHDGIRRHSTRNGELCTNGEVPN